MNDYSEPAILDSQMFHSFQPMPLLKRAAPFDDPDWVVLHFGGIHSSLRVTPAMEVASRITFGIWKNWWDY